MDVSSIMRLESRTNPANFKKKSVSFYCDINHLGWLMGCKEVLLVHTCNQTGEQRKMVVSGMRLYNSLEYRSYNKKPVLVYRY